MYIDHNNNCINNSDKTNSPNSLNINDISEKYSDEIETYDGNTKVNLPTVDSEIRKANEDVNVFFKYRFHRK